MRGCDRFLLAQRASAIADKIIYDSYSSKLLILVHRVYMFCKCWQIGCNFWIFRLVLCIPQGLANLDPDVDAIYRLTQPLNVQFKTNLPAVVLPEGTMCPWNSQNTLFARDALWGLLIPITTTFRVCDIWRRYTQECP